MTTRQNARTDEAMSAAQGGQHDHEHRDSVGSVAEEAVKLAEALQEWASRQAGGAGPGAGTSGADIYRLLAGALGASSEHVATGSAECRVCPICRMIGLARGAGPDFQTHLADAGVAVLRAAAAAAEAVGKPRPDPDFEHIDLDVVAGYDEE